jgi:hypothetical protein
MKLRIPIMAIRTRKKMAHPGDRVIPDEIKALWNDLNTNKINTNRSINKTPGMYFEYVRSRLMGL